MNKIKAKFIYYTISLLVILGIFFLFFGLLGVIIERNNLDYVLILAIILALIGLLITMMGIHYPQVLFGEMLKKPDQQREDICSPLWATILGLSFVIGGLLYAHTRNVDSILIALGIGIFIVPAILKFLLD